MLPKKEVAHKRTGKLAARGSEGFIAKLINESQGLTACSSREAPGREYSKHVERDEHVERDGRSVLSSGARMEAAAELWLLCSNYALNCKITKFNVSPIFLSLWYVSCKYTLHDIVYCCMPLIVSNVQTVIINTSQLCFVVY